MRKKLLLLFLATFCASFVACTQDSPQESPPLAPSFVQEEEDNNINSNRPSTLFSVTCLPLPQSQNAVDIPNIDFSLQLLPLMSVIQEDDRYLLQLTENSLPDSERTIGFIAGSYEVENASDPFKDVFEETSATVYISQLNISAYPVLLQVQQLENSDENEQYQYNYYVYGEDGLVLISINAPDYTQNQTDYYNTMIESFELQ